MLQLKILSKWIYTWEIINWKKKKKKKENTQKIAHNEVGRDPNTQHTWKLGIIWLKRGSSGFQGFAALSPMKSPDVLPPGR